MHTKIGWGLMTLLALGIVLVASRYLSLNPEVFFPPQRTVYLAQTTGIISHIVGGMLALGLGPFQFLRGCVQNSLPSTAGLVESICWVSCWAAQPDCTWRPLRTPAPSPALALGRWRSCGC